MCWYVRRGRVLAALLLGAIGLAPSMAQETPGLRIGLIDPSTQPGQTGAEGMPPRNAAAFAFAESVGTAVRLAPRTDGGWVATDGTVYAPEEFDVLWYHQGDTPGVPLGDVALADLGEYVESGGALLLSGAAGALLNNMGIEPVQLRVLGTTDAAYESGFIPRDDHRDHAIFRGFDLTKAVLLTSLGGNALADFYDTAGPTGTLLAEGNAGLGERPVVEYRFGEGRVLFVGWRLPDFTTAGDAHRPNLDRFFSNILAYLSDGNRNRGTIVRPQGPARYVRIAGVPFLRAETEQDLSTTEGAGWVVTLTGDATGATAVGPDGIGVREGPLAAGGISARALAMTTLGRERPVSSFVAARQAEEERAEAETRALTDGLRVITPTVQWVDGPLSPGRPTLDTEQSVLVGHSPHMAPGNGLGDITPVYEPIRDGGFRIAGSRRTFNRPIVRGQARLWTGDAPLFRLDAATGAGCYAEDRVFPLWPRPDAASAQTTPTMGTLRLGVPGPDGNPVWFDEMADGVTTFRPGYTEYRLARPDPDGWHATVVVASPMEAYGLVCRVTFDRPVDLVWRYGGLWWQQGESRPNRAEMVPRGARLADASLPNGLVLAGWDADGAGQIVAGPQGEEVEYRSAAPGTAYHVAAVWGVTDYDRGRAEETMARLDTPIAAAWPEARDRLKQVWFDDAIGRALEPERRFGEVMADPEGALTASVDWWDARRQEFQIRTPDEHLDALINWTRCMNEYHHRGPGLVLGAQIWQMYSHISTGWYGKQWGGDHATMSDTLRLYGAFQADDGFIRWISPSLVPFTAENNTAYWVDQVWWHYAWTGDEQFVRDLWPAVRNAVSWQRAHNDPDGDGLFRDWYEYWNCDSNGKGPKAAAPSGMSWAMLDRAARLARVVGDAGAEAEYQALADQSRDAILRELWHDDAGRLGSIGADGLWRGHGQVWEQYLAANAGLLSPEQARSAMRWLAAHYGFEPNPGVKLLSNSDWFPIRWSVQWVPTGDTCLAALAGIRAGDADLWYPFLETAVLSSFRSDFPGINMGISNAGAGGGDREDVDSEDPFPHAVVRGLFGIEPAIHEGRLLIEPMFPSGWTEASIRTPDVSYGYRRTGDEATVTIQTPRPLVRQVRVGLGGQVVTTPPETESVVTVRVGPQITPPDPPPNPPTLRDQLPEHAPIALPDGGRSRLRLCDLLSIYNTTVEGMASTSFIFDYADGPQPLTGWWGNPGIARGPGPRAMETEGGIVFLVTPRGRPGLGQPGNDLVALTSWRPSPFPGGLRLTVGERCERVYLLLLSYVHPMKNYIVNGEVVLHYADGTAETISLIPPYNLDCYFQHFSLEGERMTFGRGVAPGGAFSFVTDVDSHADALELRCDPTRVLDGVELRATCSEGVLGLLGMTVLASDGE